MTSNDKLGEAGAVRADGNERMPERRRLLLKLLGRAGAYAAPVTLAMLNLKANASS